MRFPLRNPAFPPVALTPDQREAFTALAARRLEDALQAYDRFVAADARAVDRSRWKPIKTRERVTVYRERLRRKPAVRPGNGDDQDDDEWRLPRLLGVGTLDGPLEDVMFGTQSPSAAHMLVKADYCEDDVVDAEVLHELAGPTLAHPFRFLGLKWLVKRHPAGMDAVVLPRDLVYLETTGIATRPDGTRVGHFLIHSVELPQCRELRQDRGIVRSRVSSCFLFRELPGGGAVDVYMTGQVEPNGRILDRAALLSTASGLICFWRAVVCAQHRKLAWRLQHPPRPRNVSLVDAATATHCRVCERPFGAFSSTSACEMCGARLCGRCRVSKKLSLVDRRGSKEINVVTVDLCRPCVVVTSREDAASIARQEIRAAQYGSLSSPRSHRSRPRRGFKKSASDPVMDEEQATEGGDRSGKSSLELELVKLHTNDTDLSLSTRSTDLSLTYLDDLVASADQLELSGSAVSDDEQDWRALLTESDSAGSLGELADEEIALSDQQQQQQQQQQQTQQQQQQAANMWEQISALRRVAEATYHFAKENTEQTLLLTTSYVPPPVPPLVVTTTPAAPRVAP